MSEKPGVPSSEEQQPVVWRRRVVVIVVLLVAAAIAGRVFLAGEDTDEQSADRSGLRSGLVDDDGQRVEREETLGQKLGKLLPYITEAGMALLVGMILGIGTRMAIKTIVVVAVVGIVGIQFAIFKGWMSADSAGGFIGHMREYVFNVPAGGDAVDVLREKAPTVGASLLGFMMGLKKG